MTVVRLREGDPPAGHELPDHVADALAATDVISLVRGSQRGTWLLSDAGKVGVVRSGGLEIWVRPKIDIRRLVFLIGYARDSRGWRDATVPLQADAELLPALAIAFAQQAERTLRQGLLHGYRQHEEALPVLRGRIRESEQMRRRFGFPVPLEVRYDDFSVDVAENQVLKAAVARALQVPRVPEGVRRVLRRLLLIRLDGVTELAPGALQPWHPTRLNARYHVALRLAEVLLAATSFEQGRGDLRVSGFLFDMAKVFEDFVCVALKEALVLFGGRTEFQLSTYLDEHARVRMRPDVVWLRHQTPAAVVDAKYKAERPRGFPDADLYQMLAYCTALHLPVGHLVYAQGNEEPASYVVRHAGTRLICHALNLDTDPSEVLKGVRDVSRSVRSTAAARDR